MELNYDFLATTNRMEKSLKPILAIMKTRPWGRGTMDGEKADLYRVGFLALCFIIGLD